MNYDAVNNLIGTQWAYKENDCYAIVEKGLRSIFGVELPAIEIPEVSDPNKNTSLFSFYSTSANWVNVESPEPGDVVMFYNKHNRPFHCGLYIEKGHALHCFGTPKHAGQTVYEKLRNMNKSIYSSYKFYRYAHNTDI